MFKQTAFIQALGVLFIGISLLGFLIYGFFITRSGMSERTITVNGKVSRSIQPDKSTLTGTWVEKAGSGDEARSSAQDKASKGIEKLVLAGVDKKDLLTTQVSVYPEYDYGVEKSQPKVVGYLANTTVQITVKDLKKIDSLLKIFTESGVESTAGPNTGLSPEYLQQLEKELKVAAVADAKKQAEALVKESGGRLGKVLSINGGGITQPNSGPEYPIPMADVATDASRSSTPSDIVIGESEIEVSVNVTYKLK